MVVTITMKNVIQRGEIYYFRNGVPAECRDSVGKREITQSLKTSDPVGSEATGCVESDEGGRSWPLRMMDHETLE